MFIFWQATHKRLVLEYRALKVTGPPALCVVIKLIHQFTLLSSCLHMSSINYDIWENLHFVFSMTRSFSCSLSDGHFFAQNLSQRLCFTLKRWPFSNWTICIRFPLVRCWGYPDQRQRRWQLGTLNSELKDTRNEFLRDAPFLAAQERVWKLINIACVWLVFVKFLKDQSVHLLWLW